MNEGDTNKNHESTLNKQNHENRKQRKWGRKHLHPKQYKVADKSTLKRVLNPNSRPEPEFQGQDYITGKDTNVNILYQCNEPNCAAKFTTELGLNIHTTTHFNRNIKCKFCTVIFKTEQDLTEHCATFHPDLKTNPHANPLECQKCGKITRDVKALWRHVRETHRNKIYACPYCDLQVLRPESLKEHLSIKHPENGEAPSKHVCKVCSREFTYTSSLRSHIREIHRGSPQKTFKCVLCNTVYFRLCTYNRHMTRHTDPKYFPCHVCNRKFDTMSHLKRHEESLSHAKLVTTKASLKPAEFKVPVIKAVTTAKNPNLTKEQLIELCQKTVAQIVLHRVDSTCNASRSLAIVRRKRIQQQQSIAVVGKRKRGRPRKNDIGNVVTAPPVPPPRSPSPPPKLFLPKTKVSIGKADAGNPLYLNCIYCDKPLANLDAVKVHEYVCYSKLRNKKLLICPVCNKEFDYKYKLKLHCQITHTTERPLQCSYCDATFKSRPTKVQHEKAVHFGIRYKPKEPVVYQCNYAGCDKQYNNRKGLRRHVSANHLGIRYQCEKCDRKYRRPEQYRKHLKTDHAECPTRLECKPCKRTYKEKWTYLAHLRRDRHKRKSRAYERRKNKRKQTEHCIDAQ